MTVGVDSWVSILYADAYVTDKFGEALWPPLSNPDKEKLLVTAFRKIVSIFSIPASSTAEKVKQAQVEMALFILHYYKDMEKRGSLQAMGVQSFNISGFSESYGSNKSNFIPAEVESLLSDYSAKVIISISRSLDE